MGMISIDDEPVAAGEGGLVRTDERAAIALGRGGGEQPDQPRCGIEEVNLIRVELQAGRLAPLWSRGSACLSCGKK